MNRLRVPVFFVCFLSIQSFCFSDESDASRMYFQPMLSYKILSFENIVLHNPAGGFSVTRINSVSKNVFSVATMYTPIIIKGIQDDYPIMYHTIVLSLNGKIGRHAFLGAFTANTDKPLYGGLHTFNVLAGYTYDLIRRPHFSMVLGGYLLFKDIGINLPDGSPWLLWPLPFLTLKWDYEWIDISVLPGISITIADGKPVSFTVSKKSDDFDASLWYHYFRNRNPSAEIFGVGIGIKNTTSEVNTSAGDIYGINYYALYGGIKIFRLIEITGGWAFNGKEKYGKTKWDSIFKSYGYSDEFEYETAIGNGFFFSISARFITS